MWQNKWRWGVYLQVDEHLVVHFVCHGAAAIDNLVHSSAELGKVCVEIHGLVFDPFQYIVCSSARRQDMIPRSEKEHFPFSWLTLRQFSGIEAIRAVSRASSIDSRDRSSTRQRLVAKIVV